jgi:transposase
MDKESISRLGLDYIRNIDVESSDEIYDPITNNHIIILKLNKLTDLSCPHCGLVGEYRPRSSITQIIKHASAIENNILIKLYRRVYICECGKTFREENPFTSSKRRTTLQKEFKVLMSLKDIHKSFSDVAKEFDLSTQTVINIFDSKVDIRRQTLTQVLCVDEIYSKHCGYHKYCFILFSPQLNKILDVLPSRNKNDLFDYFAQIPIEERNKVQYFSMDLYAIYKEVAEICFPNAIICADHFHVIKNISDLFNKARIRIMKNYEHLKNRNDSWYWLYKKYWKLLLKAPEKLKYKKFKVSKSGMHLSEREIVRYMLSIDKNLKDAYELLNEYRVFNSVATINNAAEWLDELIIKFHNSSLDEFYKAYKLLKKWRNEIINSFNTINGYRISNGGMERANNDIKTIIRHSFGFTNFNRFRNKVMFSKNKDASILSYRKNKK